MALAFVVAAAPAGSPQESGATDAAYAAYIAGETARLPGTPATPIDCSRLDKFALPGPPDGAAAVVPVDGQPFSKAVRVTVGRAVDPPWSVQIITPKNRLPIKKGDTILLGYNVRCPKSAAGSGCGHFAGFMQLDREPWDSFGGFAAAPGAGWFKGYAHGVAARDFAPGEFEIAFHLGQYAQTLEVGGLIAVNLGRNTDPRQIPFSRITYAGREPDAAWRQEAAARIEKFRKGELTIRVTGAGGKPLAGATVRARMTRHAYGFGTYLEDAAEWKNPDGQKYRDRVEQWFSRVTVPVYWADWGWPGAREKYLARAAWARARGFQIRGHNIVWPGWGNMPQAVRQYGDDPAKLRAVIRDHVAENCASFKRFGFADYDVVNEPRDNHAVMDLCGKGIVVEWFKLARRIDPAPRLGVNESSIIAGGGWATAQQDRYEEQIECLLEHGAPLGVIGFQCHFGEDLTPPARVVEILDRFAKFQLPLHATEFDVNSADEEVQADYLRDFFTVFFSHPQTAAITLWGFWEKVQWIPRAALVRPDWTLKPNGRAYEERVLGKWWTDVTGKTAADGTLAIRGFLGDYEDRNPAVIGREFGSPPSGVDPRPTSGDSHPEAVNHRGAISKFARSGYRCTPLLEMFLSFAVFGSRRGSGDYRIPHPAWSRAKSLPRSGTDIFRLTRPRGCAPDLDPRSDAGSG